MEFKGDVGVVGFEEGRVWLPRHVFDEAFEPKENLWPNQQAQPQPRTHGHGVGVNPSFLAAADKVSRNHPPHTLNNKLSSKLHPRPRFHAGRASGGGPGMQAVFLDSNQKSCGTGFFLPRRLGNNNNNNFQMSKKPACSPVLLPSRVIQALNLNVHALGSQLTPPKDQENNPRLVIRNSDDNKNGSHDLESTVTTKSCVASATRRSSPEIFLPKEWSY